MKGLVVKQRDTTWIIAFLALGAVGLYTFLANYDRALPIASLDFKLSPDEAFIEAQQFAVSRGHDLSGFESAQIFSSDLMPQIFIQKSLGLEESNRFAREWISIFSWRFRWYRPLKKEEIHVHLDPGGRVVSYSHRILDEDEGASLTEAEAEPIATRFLFETLGFDRAGWDEVERSSEERTARTDHTFTFRKQGFTVGEDGHYRMEVVVQGDRVGQFDEFVHVPDTFQRAFEKTRSQAGLLNSVFTIAWVALGIGVLVILAQRYRAGGLQWRSSTILGVAVVAAAMVAQLNGIPLIKYSFDTTQSMSFFYITIVLAVVVGSVINGSIVTMAGTAGAWITRNTFGNSELYPRLSLRNVVAGRYVRATLIGYGIAGCMLGYQIAWMLVGKKLFGVWMPAGVIEYSNAFSTVFPWIYPLLIGLIAATLEEFFFRLLAIPLLLRWLKIKWLAIVIPAVVWGFLHSNYPVEPIYARGIELTIVGIGLGVVFLKWGVWSVIVAHYGYNAFVTALPMMKSTSTYFQVSGIAVIGLLAVPVLFAAISAARGRIGQEAEEETDPEQAPPSRTVPSADEAGAPETFEVVPLSSYLLTRGQRLGAIVICLVGFGVYTSMDLPHYGEATLDLAIDRGEAYQKADSVRAVLGWELEGSYDYVKYRDGLGFQGYTYLVRRLGMQADSLIATATYPRQWQVRWFKPKEKTEFRIGIDPTGRLASLRRILPDSLAGAELSSDDARVIAETGLQDHFAVDVMDSSAYKRLEAKSDKRENRLDHTFVWERLAAKVDSGEFRVQAIVQGDSFGGASFGFKAPESFMRELRETGTKDAIISTVQTVAVVALVILGTLAFFRLYREGTIAWRAPLVFGGIAFVSGVIGQINESPLFFDGLRTSQSMVTFLGLKGVGLVLLASLGPLLVAVLAALAIALYRSNVPGHPDPVEWVRKLRSGEGRGLLLIDSCLAIGAFGMISRAIGSIQGHLHETHFLQHMKVSRYSPENLDTLSPFLSSVGDLFFAPGIMIGMLTAILVAKHTVRDWKWMGLLLVGFILVTNVNRAQDFTHGLFLVSFGLVSMVATIAYLVKVIRYNLLAYVIGMVFLGNIWGAVFLMESNVPWHDINAIAMIALYVSPILLGIYLALAGRRADPS